ncbi:putative peroxygenase 4-like [Dorcoceras hygrometricum]|uniref:Putative peroxygenase 4-like n=1 Tax=Dorcoceras hygrometricum TaxID=472368 RepID=A0A2Z7C029_9LAMI|nr:putative peroxygenase 4-like [Dorcoceras hygrometricum]
MQGKPFSKDFPIEIRNINFAKHTSDSGVFDKDGRFIESKFEEIFTNNARTRPDALTSDELEGFLKSNRQPKDYGGWYDLTILTEVHSLIPILAFFISGVSPD